jgi:sarcosine oxidase subunit beta
VEYGRSVTGFERRGGTVAVVLAGGEAIACERVVIAAGALSPALGALAGVEIPGFALRIEAMALEPVRPVLRAAVALPDRLCYLHQTARGEVVGGAHVAERPQVTLRTDAAALAATASAFAEAVPCLARLRILRQWAGLLHRHRRLGAASRSRETLGVGGLVLRLRRGARRRRPARRLDDGRPRR